MQHVECKKLPKHYSRQKHKYHQQRLDNADIQTYFSRYNVPCGDISVTDTLVSLPAAAKLPSRMFISVKSPNAFTLAMGYLFLLSTRVNADTWNLTSVFRPSFSAGSSTPINEKQKKQKLCIGTRQCSKTLHHIEKSKNVMSAGDNSPNRCSRRI